jgi:hypothetical protein
VISDLLFVLVVAVTLLLLWRGVRSGGSPVEFAPLAGGVFAGWVLPQMLGLHSSQDLPAGFLERAMAMTALCGLGLYAGYAAGAGRFRALGASLDWQRLLAATTALFCVALVFQAAFYRLPQELVAKNHRMEGVAVALLFFGGNMDSCLAIVVLAMLAGLRPGKRGCFILAVGLGKFGHSIIFQGRRSETLELLFILLAGYWFRRKVLPPRWLLAGAGLALTLFFFGIHAYRQAMVYQDEPDWSRLASIPYMESFNGVLENGGLELRNAAYLMAASDNGGDFDYGLAHFNNLVQSFVPRQLVGADLKDSLKVGLGDRLDLAERAFGFQHVLGSTATGFAGSFGSFWYFGCLEFVAIAWAMRRLYRGAQAGVFAHQVAYITLLVPGLLALTHNVDYFINALVRGCVFLLPLYWYARRRPGDAPGRPAL